MKAISPTQWPWSTNRSPEPIPDSPCLHTSRMVYPLIYPDELTNMGVVPETKMEIEGEYEATFDKMIELLSNAEVVDAINPRVRQKTTLGTLSDFLASEGSEPLEKRTILISPSEAASPYRLAEMGVGIIPLLPVKLVGLASIWADSIDDREVKPGTHHVTLGRLDGWWEDSVIALVTQQQLDSIARWFSHKTPNSWTPMRLNEGEVILKTEFSATSQGHPTTDMVIWDGRHERVEGDSSTSVKLEAKGGDGISGGEFGGADFIEMDYIGDSSDSRFGGGNFDSDEFGHGNDEFSESQTDFGGGNFDSDEFGHDSDEFSEPQTDFGGGNFDSDEFGHDNDGSSYGSSEGEFGGDNYTEGEFDDEFDRPIEREAGMKRVGGIVLPLNQLVALIHTNQGIYNNRGRLPLTKHISQRKFSSMFRRGSSKTWNEVLDAEQV